MRHPWPPRITVTVFCTLLFLFTAAAITTPSKEFSETENRVLAQRPKLTWETIINGKFEDEYEAYLTDQFILRDQWIYLKTSVEKLLLKRESKDIYFARDEYLIEKHSGSFSSSTARRNLDSLALFVQQYCLQFEPDHLSVMIVPNAVEIFKNKLPPFAPPSGEKLYLEQAAASLPKNIWFDSAAVLQLHQEEELYYRTDHHWKTIAAFYVYQQWAATHGCSVPRLADNRCTWFSSSLVRPSDVHEPAQYNVYRQYTIETVTDCFQGTIQSKLGIKTISDTIELFFPKEETFYSVQTDHSEEIKNSLYDWTALDTKDKYAVYFGGNHGFLKIKTASDSSRRILVIRDSYASCFIPFLISEFQEIDVVDLRYTNQKLSQLIAEGKYSDLLILYNAAGFAEDISISKLTN